MLLFVSSDFEFASYYTYTILRFEKKIMRVNIFTQYTRVIYVFFQRVENTIEPPPFPTPHSHTRRSPGFAINIKYIPRGYQILMEISPY